MTVLNSTKKLFLCTATALCLSVTSTYSHALTMEEIIIDGTLKVVTEDNYAPFNFMNRNKPDGFNNDLLKELQSYSKGKFIIDQTIMPWTGLLASVTSNQYSMAVTGVMVTKERLKVFNFSKPLASSQSVYVKLKSNKNITDIASLSEKTVGVQSGTVFYANLPQLEAMLKDSGGKLGKVIQYQSYPEAYADLASKRIDYVINSEININDLIKKRSAVFAKGQAVSSPSYFSWPLAKNSPELLNYVDGFIEHIKKNGTLAKLQTKWFGQKFPNLPDISFTTKEQLLQAMKQYQ